MNKYIVEFIGTFFLVLVVGITTTVPGVGGIPPLAIGATLMVMVFAGGHISGAHYNPAVTLAVYLRGKCSTADVPGYLIAQLLAAGVAAALVLFVFGGTGDGVSQVKNSNFMRALSAETLWTFALAYVVLNVATAKGTANNSFYGLAIGFTVVAGAFTMGPLSGGAFNPAVAVGQSINGGFAVADLWLYLLGDFLGGAAAATVFKLLNPGDVK